jgi:hypothetical protein
MELGQFGCRCALTHDGASPKLLSLIRDVPNQASFDVYMISWICSASFSILRPLEYMASAL